MAGRRMLWLALLAAGSLATAGEHAPDEDFLEFLGSLEADEDFQEFFESVPDELVNPEPGDEEEYASERD